MDLKTTPEKINDDTTGLTRREVLKTAAAGAGLALLLPTLAQQAHAEDQWTAAGKATLFVLNQAQRVALPNGAILQITRTSDKELTAVSAKCTHRGCELGWDKENKNLLCPCHGAVFATTGKNIHGTRRSPDRMLTNLQVIPARQTGDQVEVNLTSIALDTLKPGGD